MQDPREFIEFVTFEQAMAQYREKTRQGDQSLFDLATEMHNRWQEGFDKWAANNPSQTARIEKNRQDLSIIRRLYGHLAGSLFEKREHALQKAELAALKELYAAAMEELSTFKTLMKMKSLTPDIHRLYEDAMDSWLAHKTAAESKELIEEMRKEILDGN